jgi:hypothetical protein
MVYSVCSDRGEAEPSYPGVGFQIGVSAVAVELGVTNVGLLRCESMSGTRGARDSECLWRDLVLGRQDVVCVCVCVCAGVYMPAGT